MSIAIRIVAGVLALATAGTLAAADLKLPSNMPHRKPGLWITQVKAGAEPQLEMKMCVDPATEAALYRHASGFDQRDCSKMEVAMRGNELVSDSICKLPRFMGRGGGTVTEHSVTRFEGNTAYHTESSARYDPPMDGKAEHKGTIDARWSGRCEAGQKPGDVVVHGMTFNVINGMDIKSMMKGMLNDAD